MDSKVIAIIPARKNSKRLPQKNKKLLCNQPMIQYTIDAAKKSKLIDRIIVTTDDEDIMVLAANNNVEVHNRNPELAKDDTLLPQVIEDMQKECNITNDDIIVLLQPTSPTRTGEMLDYAIKTFILNEVELVISTKFLPPNKIYIPNGLFYIFRGTKIWYDKTLAISYSERESIDVDTEFDFRMAEMYIREKTNAG